MANPPAPTSHAGSPVTHGTILHYGVADLSVSGILVESYRRSGKYAKHDEVIGQNGIVEGVRLSDFRAEVSVSGKMLESGTATAKAGDVLAINGDNILIMDVNISASATGFAQMDITGTAYEGVTGLSPA